MNITQKLGVYFTLLSLFFWSIPALAADTSALPQCQFSGQPTAEQLATCQAAAAAQAQSQAVPTTPTTQTVTSTQVLAPISVPSVATDMGQIEKNMALQGWTLQKNASGNVVCAINDNDPTGIKAQQCQAALGAYNSMNPGNSTAPGMPDMSKIDFSKFGPMPTFTNGGPTPEFMGMPIAGPSMGMMNGSGAGNDMAAQAMAQMAGQLGGALENIKEGLTSAEEGIKEMKDGQIKVDNAMEKSVVAARAIYNQAVDLFKAGDYQSVAAKLQELQTVGFDKKYASFADNNGISQDLINDIRAKLKNALKQIGKVEDPADQLEAQSDIMTSMNYLDEAEKLLKAGKKKEAAAKLKEMKNASGVGAGQLDIESGVKALNSTQLSKILDKINTGLTNAGSGIEKAKANNIEVSADMISLIEQGKSIYDQAKAAFDQGDNMSATKYIIQLQEMNFKEKSMAFRDQMLPNERLAMILKTAQNGNKALAISIEKAKEFGVNTADLETLKQQYDDLLAKGELAFNAKDTDLFLTIMEQIDNMQVRDKVDAAIRVVANERAKVLVSDGLTATKQAIDSLSSAIDVISKNNGNITLAKSLLDEANQFWARANESYNQTQYMVAGRYLDDSASRLIKLGYNVTDIGKKLTEEQKNALNNMTNIISRTDDMANTSADQATKAKAFLGDAAKGNSIDIKQTLMGLNPELLEKVLASREKDKKIIDSVIKDVIPLVPEKDRQVMLEGKMDLLEEASSANKTIAVMKQAKGLAKDTVSTMQNIDNQIKQYNFTAKDAEKLQQKMEQLNNAIQSGDVKNPKEITNYVNAMKDQVNASIKSSADQKYRQNIIPAKNIDDNNSLFDEIKYLKDDGAIKADIKGNINLDQKVNSKMLNDMINKTIDAKVSNLPNKNNMTVQEVAKSVLDSYKIKAPVDTKNPAQLTKFLNGIGAEVKVNDMKQKADVADVAEILAAADQRWGAGIK